MLLSIHLLMDIWVAPTLWLIVNKVAMNTGAQISLWVSAFNSLGYISNSIVDFLRTVYTVFHTAVLFSHPTTVHMNSSFSTSWQCLWVSVFYFLDSSHPEGYEIVLLSFDRKKDRAASLMKMPWKSEPQSSSWPPGPCGASPSSLGPDLLLTSLLPPCWGPWCTLCETSPFSTACWR